MPCLRIPIIDFVTGDLLYLAVVAEIIWEGDEVTAFEGAERLIRFTVQGVRYITGVLPFRWTVYLEGFGRRSILI